MKPFLFSFLITAALTAAPGTPQTTPSPNIERLFRVKCAVCHGVDGAGGAGASFKRKLAHPTVGGIEVVIKQGIPGTSMPANPVLTGPIVHDLAMYVLYLNKKK